MRAISKITSVIVLVSFFMSSSVYAQTANSNFNNKINIKPVFSQQKNNFKLPEAPSNIEQGNVLKQESVDQIENQVVESSLNSKDKETDKLYNLSHIEEIFNPLLKGNVNIKNSVNRPIMQFGYDIFSNNLVISANSKISPSYKLDSGDKVNIYLWGDSLDLMSITGNDFIKSVVDIIIDKEGNIFVPGAGVIQAKGKTVSNVEQQISSILSGKITNFRVKVSVNDIGSFPVFVMGNVKSPGTVYINDSSSLLDILTLSGGVLKEGSLRDIIYTKSQNKSKTKIDLYDLILNGNYKQIKFKEGDVILVKPVGKVVALNNGVKRPAIYEFKDGESLKDLIRFAGGFLPSINTKLIQVQSYDASSGQKKAVDVNFNDLSKINLKDGDSLEFKSMYQIAENTVVIEGNVKHPDSFQYKKGMKLSDILKSKDELLTRTYLAQAVIERVAGSDRDIMYIPVSLTDFFNGYTDPELQSQDKIKIYPNTKMQNIEISGYVLNPGIVPFKEGMTLKGLLGSINFGSNSDIEYVNKVKDSPNKVMTSDLVAEISNDITEDTITTENTIKTVYLYDLLTKNDKNADIELNAGDKILFRSVTNKETVKTVKVLGYVNNPGVYKFRTGMQLTDAIQLAGGLSKDAYLKGLVLLRPTVSQAQKIALQESLIKLQEEISLKTNEIQSINNSNDNNSDITAYINNQKELLNTLREKASKEYGRINIDINSNDIKALNNIQNIELREDDEIFIPFISQHVVVIGEVLNQSAIAFNPDKTVKYYLDRVGGFTDQAVKNKIYVIEANGITKKVKRISSTTVHPGDSIVIPRKVTLPINWLEISKTFAQIISSGLSTIFIMTKI
ncbi:MAG: SLBB domain-containing protein [Candidatus Gastranaerophilales bacterium]|nr:SLBB domain-containing protein [Candidatus Gastranaerophilales bacterium]